ncbi:MAG: M28 family peptidase [Terriglobales bacterium]|jgi:Zn-dependent M28 family amino/carboxypeptidase
MRRPSVRIEIFPAFARGPASSLGLRIWLVLALSAALAQTAACAKGTSANPVGSGIESGSAVSAPAPLPATAAGTPLPHIDAQRTFQYTREVTAFGPRYMGSENHKKLERYIVNHLKGDQVEDDAFTADTVEGKFPVRNIIDKFAGTKDGILVIMGHYDTNYPLRGSGYVGANDGGSSTAILLEFADQLRGEMRNKKRAGYSVWLVWTDGEEAVKSWSDTDSVYGSRHLAEKWEKDGTLKKVKALMVMDMIGDADLDIQRNTKGAPWLLDLIYTAAERVGYQSHFYASQGEIEDDHIPFVNRGVPCADVIDLDYGYNNVFHHTPQDTMDKLSPKSLEIAGDTIMEAIRLLDQRYPSPEKP